LLDVGCGRGGPGIWIARELGATLVGVDIAAKGVAVLYQKAADLKMSSMASFYVANATQTGLPTASFDGTLIFTTWESPHLDCRWYLETAVFREIVSLRSKVLPSGSALNTKPFLTINQE
jgi:hypothetical protein